MILLVMKIKGEKIYCIILQSHNSSYVLLCVSFLVVMYEVGSAEHFSVYGHVHMQNGMCFLLCSLPLLHFLIELSLNQIIVKCFKYLDNKNSTKIQ